jgi:hypothetical protein
MPGLDDASRDAGRAEYLACVTGRKRRFMSDAKRIRAKLISRLNQIAEEYLAGKRRSLRQKNHKRGQCRGRTDAHCLAGQAWDSAGA